MHDSLNVVLWDFKVPHRLCRQRNDRVLVLVLVSFPTYKQTCVAIMKCSNKNGQNVLCGVCHVKQTLYRTSCQGKLGKPTKKKYGSERKIYLGCARSSLSVQIVHVCTKFQWQSESRNYSRFVILLEVVSPQTACGIDWSKVVVPVGFK